MAAIGYANMYPRSRPPGWEQTKQYGSVLNKEKQRHSSKDIRNTITFEIWDDENKNKHGNNNNNVPQGPIDKLFSSIAKEICKVDVLQNGEKKLRLEAFKWKELANLAWSYATHGEYSDETSKDLLVTISNLAVERLLVYQRERDVGGGAAAVVTRDFLPKDVSMIMWSLGSLAEECYELGDKLVSLVDATARCWLGTTSTDQKRRPLREWGTMDLIQLAHAMSHGRIDHPLLLESLFTEVLHKINDKEQHLSDKTFRTYELTVLMWAKARLYLTGKTNPIYDVFDDRVCAILLQRIRASSSSLREQELANLAWSLTVLQPYKRESSVATNLTKEIFRLSALAAQKGKGLVSQHAHQLWQAYTVLSHDCPEAVHVPQEFCNLLEERWANEKARAKVSSARHRAISETLDLMGVAHYNEHDEDIDVAIVLKENSSWTHDSVKGSISHNNRVAVEFDGPLHFTRQHLPWFEDITAATSTTTQSSPPRPLGHTILKYWILKLKNWNVVRIPYYEFDKIPFWAGMERQRYLQRQLKTHPSIQFSSIDVSEYKAQVPNRQSRYD